METYFIKRCVKIYNLGVTELKLNCPQVSKDHSFEF